MILRTVSYNSLDYTKQNLKAVNDTCGIMIKEYLNEKTKEQICQKGYCSFCKTYKSDIERCKKCDVSLE